MGLKKSMEHIVEQLVPIKSKYYKIFLIIFLIISASKLYSQADTNIMYEDSVLYKGRIINQIIDGKKEGVHITFNFGHTNIISTLYTDFTCSTKYVYHDIRPLYDTIYQELLIHPTTRKISGGDTVLHNFWTIDPEIIAQGKYKSGFKEGKWDYLIDPEFLPINKSNAVRAVGKYVHDNKNGEWKYYYPNGKFFAIVNYNNGVPISPIRFYDKQGRVEARLTPLNEDMFYDCKIDTFGNIIRCDTTNIDDYRIVFGKH